MSVRMTGLVARFHLFELFWSPRTLAMLAIAAAPIGLALAYRAALAFRMTQSAGGEVFASLVSGVFFPFVVPMLALVYASGIVRDDAEAGTLPYYLARPVPRSSFLSGKMISCFAITAALVLPSIVVTYYLAHSPSGRDALGAGFPNLARTLGVAALGLAAYNGIFAVAGTALKRPLLAGLFFIFGWQAVATFVPGRARLFTVAHYMVSLTGASPGSLFGALTSGRSSPLLSFLALLAIAGMMHVLAVVLFARKEIR
jgi:ABC-type transport system involved in multi-copper enzyme maturation permease subunit